MSSQALRFQPTTRLASGARFCPLSVARVVLGVTDGALQALIADGQLRWVLDVMAGTGETPSLRVWHPGVIGLARRDPLASRWAVGAIIESVFPAAQASFPVAAVAFALTCTADVVRSHLAAGRLAGEGDNITRASVAKFTTDLLAAC